MHLFFICRVLCNVWPLNRLVQIVDALGDHVNSVLLNSLSIDVKSITCDGICVVLVVIWSLVAVLTISPSLCRERNSRPLSKSVGTSNYSLLFSRCLLQFNVDVVVFSSVLPCNLYSILQSFYY